NGIDEIGDVEDAVLEQIPDASAAGLSQQFRRVGRLDILREDEDGGVRCGSTKLEGGAQAFVAEVGRQADVDDCDVRLLAERRVDKGVCVGTRRDDVETVVAEEPCEPLAEEREILGDYDPHGSSARIDVGPPAGLETKSEPSSASTRRLRPT